MLPLDVWGIDQDVTNVLETMRQSGHMVLQPDGRYRCNTVAIDMDAPYVFFSSTKAHDFCHIYFDILFLRFGVIPAHCQKKCWKIVVRCENFAEFVQTFNLLADSGEDFLGKGGHDPREFTGGSWPVFIYNSSLEEAKDNWFKVVNLLGKDMTEKVIVKQGCTEMEMQVPLTLWKVTERQKQIELMVAERVIFDAPEKITQPEWVVKEKVRKWAKAAHNQGDFSYKKFWGDRPLFSSPQTFHDGWLKG